MELNRWNVTFTYHTKEEEFRTESMPVVAETIGEALYDADTDISERLEAEGWSDYWVIGINIIPELH